MKLLFIGDCIGRPGREVVGEELPGLMRNAGPGFRRSSMAKTWPAASASPARSPTRCFAIGVDCITTGNHWLDQREILTFIGDDDRILRPANLPAGTPGRGAGLFQARNGASRCWWSARWAASSWSRRTIPSPRSNANLPPARWARAPMR